MKRVICGVMAMAGMGGEVVASDGPCAVTLAVAQAIDHGPLGVFGFGPETGPGAHNTWGMVSIGAVAEADGRPVLTTWQYGDNQWYYYPASTVKLYAALAAYEKINELARDNPDADLSEHTPLRIHSLDGDQFPRDFDSTHNWSKGRGIESGPLTAAREAHKVFVVSDNPAFNNLYDLIGPEDLNYRMQAWGATNSWVSHRLAIARTPDENRRAPRVDFGLNPALVTLPARAMDEPAGPGLLGPDATTPSVFLQAGRGFLQGGELIHGPFGFKGKNFTTLFDLQLVLCRLVRPDITHSAFCGGMFAPGNNGLRAPASASGQTAAAAVGDRNPLCELPGRPLDLTDSQREQLIASATIYPRESESPKYDPAEYPDEHVKFLLPGLLKVRPIEEWRVVNKIGLAYGFVTENAYVEHRPTGRAVFVAAVIHRNPNGIYNDNQYDYETTLAEMATLGEVVGRALVGE